MDIAPRPVPRFLSTVRQLGRRVGMSTVGSAVAFAIMGGLNDSMSLSDRGKLLVICFVYGGSMGMIGPAATPPWIRRIARQPGWSWLLGRVLALPFIIAVGGAVAAAVLVPLGLLPRRWTFRLIAPYLYGGPAVAAVAAIFLSVLFYESLRGRLERARITLSAQERDRAEARRALAEAQLASLESRVQPHFLFNTLNSIAALIPQDPVGAERMTGQLASLLRSSLDTAATPLVPLEHELKIVKDYLDIERVRFGERLTYEVQIDPNVCGLAVPRLSLQTLVENSVKYAVSPSRTGAAIWIRARLDQSGLRLEVEDDGPGFEANAELPGHGLALLRERLQMTCGETSALNVSRRQAHTVVMVWIPNPKLVRG